MDLDFEEIKKRKREYMVTQITNLVILFQISIKTYVD